MFMWNFEFQGVRSALTDTVGGAADGRRNMQKTSPGTQRLTDVQTSSGESEHVHCLVWVTVM